MSAIITTGASYRTYYGDLLENPLLSQQCVETDHVHAPIYCMWHGQTYGEHEVGGMCLDCDKQWFFESDWSTAECRNERASEGSSRLRLFMARLDRWLLGWTWRNAWSYKP